METNWKWIKIGHLLLWCIWAVLILTYQAEETRRSYELIFPNFIPFYVYVWFEILFMFGGGFLLLAALVKFLPKKSSFLAYVIFEILFIAIIIVHFIVWINQQ